MINEISVLGAGSWGTVLSELLAKNGKKIKMIQVERATIGIDTPNDLIKAKKYLESIQNV